MESSSYKRYLWLFFGLLLGVMTVSYIVNTMTTPQPAKPRGFDNELGTAYVTVHDTDGNLILQTGLPVTVNDEYISAEDIHYIIIRVDGDQALARRKSEYNARTETVPAATLSYPNNVILRTAGKKLAVYHTHNDESYLLTSGKSAEPPDGDILKVGDSMVEALRRSASPLFITKKTTIPTI